MVHYGFSERKCNSRSAYANRVVLEILSLKFRSVRQTETSAANAVSTALVWFI